MKLSPEFLTSYFEQSCILALHSLQEYYHTNIEIKRTSSGDNFLCNFTRLGSEKEFIFFRDVLAAKDKGSLKFLLNPNKWISKTWNKILPLLYNEIHLYRKLQAQGGPVKLFEIGVGTGYILFRCKNEIKDLSIRGCDIDTHIETPYTILRRLLGLTENIIDLGIYEPKVPTIALKHNILLATLPEFDFHWNQSHWRKFLHSIFCPEESQIKTFLLVTNYHSKYKLSQDLQTYKDICKPLLCSSTSSTSSNHSLIIFRKKIKKKCKK